MNVDNYAPYIIISILSIVVGYLLRGEKASRHMTQQLELIEVTIKSFQTQINKYSQQISEASGSIGSMAKNFEQALHLQKRIRSLTNTEQNLSKSIKEKNFQLNELLTSIMYSEEELESLQGASSYASTKLADHNQPTQTHESSEMLEKRLPKPKRLKDFKKQEKK